MKALALSAWAALLTLLVGAAGFYVRENASKNALAGPKRSAPSERPNSGALPEWISSLCSPWPPII